MSVLRGLASVDLGHVRPKALLVGDLKLTPVLWLILDAGRKKNPRIWLEILSTTTKRIWLDTLSFIPWE